jgi:hypothetical protein
MDGTLLQTSGSFGDSDLVQTCGDFWDSGSPGLVGGGWRVTFFAALRRGPVLRDRLLRLRLRKGRIVDSPLYVPPLGRTRSIRLNRRRAQKSRAVLARVSTPASFRCQPICLTAIGSKITAAQPLLCGELTVDRRLHGRQGSSRGCGGRLPGISREGY